MSEIKNVKSIRQKTYGVFVKPHFMLSGYKVVHNGIVVDPSYERTLQGGEPYMLYKTTTSLVELRKIIKEVFEELEQNKNLIKVCEIIPIDYLVTPLS